MSKKTSFFATLFVFVFAGFAFAQSGEYEAAATSGLAGVSLPAGALRVIPRHVPAEIEQTLEKLVATGNGKLRRGGTEMLLWTGDDLKKAGAGIVTSRLTDSLKIAGWKYEVGGVENGITIFSVMKDAPRARALIGFYVEADGTFIVAWTELHSSSEQKQPGATTGGNSIDYSFTTPAGWSRNDSAGTIVLSKDGNKSVMFFPPADSSGDLERDADRILWQVFKEFGPWHGNGFAPDYGTFERGKTGQGLEYFRAYRYAKKVTDPHDGFVPSRFDAIILLVKLSGNKVAVIVGTQPFQIDDATGSALKAIDLILYDLTFKGVTNDYNLKSEILGSWSTASGSVALAYTFNADGTYNKGGASEFRVSRDAYTDNVTTTSYGVTETYNLSGNILTQYDKRRTPVTKDKVRAYQTKYHKDPWQSKLGFLPMANPGGGTMVLTKSN